MSDREKKNGEKTAEEILKESMEEIDNLLKEGAKNVSEEIPAEEKEAEPEVESDAEPEIKPDEKEDKTISEDDDSDIIYLDEEVDELDEGMQKVEDAVKKAKRKKIAIITSCSVVGVLAAVYLGMAAFFNSHFFFSTTINEKSVSAKSVSQVEEDMMQQVADYVLVLEEMNGVTEEIVGADIDLAYQKSEALEELLKKQNPFAWPRALWAPDKWEAPVGVEYNQTKLKQNIEKLNCMNNEGKTDSVSAYPKFDGQQFVVEPEVIGNKINAEKFNETVNTFIGGFQSSLNLEKEHCYIEPKFHSESEEVLAAKDAMNKYLQAKVTYDMKPNTEVVDAEIISGWLKVDDKMNVVFDKKKVNEYIKDFAKKYDTSGYPRSFVTANGKTVQVTGGIYGWKINKEKEYKALVANIEKGEVVTREPEYSRRAVQHGGNDFGNTYAEVDLSSQHMWFVKNGKIVMDSPIVTGNPNKGNGTPQGTYTLTYKTRNATLKGQMRPDGTREYETPVAYWMPFNGGIGFHDANWQSSFGGSRYKTHGSHGCVNMPYGKAQELYSYMSAGTPVICHY